MTAVTRTRRWLPWIVVAVGIALAVAIAGGGGNDTGRAYDPTSTSASGTKALVDTLRRLDVDVGVDAGVPTPRTTALLVLVDGMSDAQRDAISSWVDQGGTLVVADRDSPLNPFRAARPTFLGFVQRDLARHCGVAALQQVGHVVVPKAALLRVRPPATGCFTSGEDAWLVTQPQGRGNLVALGGADALTNGSLGDGDNGLLAVTVLAPTRSAHVQVLPLPAPGGGRKTLADLISANVKLALAQLAIPLAGAPARSTGPRAATGRDPGVRARGRRRAVVPACPFPRPRRPPRPRRCSPFACPAAGLGARRTRPRGGRSGSAADRAIAR